MRHGGSALEPVTESPGSALSGAGARAGDDRPVTVAEEDSATAVTAPPKRRRREVILRRDSLFRRSLAVSDMCSITIALTFSALILGDDNLTPAMLAVPPLLVLVAKAMGLYDRDEHLLHKTTLDEVPALFAIATLSALLLWLSGDLLVDGQLGRRQIVGTWVLLFVLMMCGRALARYIVLRVVPVERCLLVGDPADAEELREKLAVSHSVRAEVVGVLPSRESNADGGSEGALLPDLGPVLASQEIDRVILATGPLARGPEGAGDLLYLIREVKSHGVKVSLLPGISRVAGSAAELDHLHGMTLLGMRRFEITRSSKLIKRSFDLSGSLLLLTLLAPLLLLATLAIKLDSRGPVLFRQRRVGRDGREFEMLKFRSMVSEAEQQKDELRHLNEGATGLFKISNDPRITRVGRLLRHWSLDELPQLINVVRGEMSLVGPRPLIPEEDRKIEGWYRRRLDITPGMTGHWQILGGSRIPIDEMVKLDYAYAANWSVWNDIRLLLRTVPVVLGRRGI